MSDKLGGILNVTVCEHGVHIDVSPNIDVDPITVHLTADDAENFIEMVRDAIAVTRALQATHQIITVASGRA